MADGFPLAAVKDQHRRLAKIWYPDKNESSEATERMVRINVAYEVLHLFLTKSQAGFATTESDNAEADETVNPKRGREIARMVKVALFESVFGCKINGEGEVNDICVTCGGWGREGLPHTCVIFNGRGVYFNLTRNTTSSRCAERHGNGFVQSSCPACSGSGQGATRLWSRQVTIPAGVRHGDVFLGREMGARSLNKQLNGDLVVTVELVEHPLFHKGDMGSGLGFDDLVVTVPVSYETWIAGVRLWCRCSMDTA